MRIAVAAMMLATINACGQSSVSQEKNSATQVINRAGRTLAERIMPPPGFTRKTVSGFGLYLRQLPLKPDGAKVHLYDGSLKSRQDVHAAVIGIETGNRDLQQCADAVMRLRAEYLYHAGMGDKIQFNFTNGFTAKYSMWAEGHRIKVSGNDVRWVKTDLPDKAYDCFRRYLDVVFTYAGTSSLSRELATVNAIDIQPGDVFIQGGSPGHAVIVADVVENARGEKAFLLAQSYMPAQEIHILNNPGNNKSPWYFLRDSGRALITPEWNFSFSDLKRFN